MILNYNFLTIYTVMKKFLLILLAGSAALAVASCKPENLNPENLNGNANEVTTQFVLNVTAAPSTKMSADAVQQNHNFRGIKDVKIFAYNTDIAGTPYVLNTAATPAKTYDLGLFFSSGALDNSGTNNTDGDNAVASKRVLQLSIPVGVDAMSFYGRALKASGVEDADFGASNDAATVISGTPSETVIAAKKILNDTNVESYDQTASLMILVINDILKIYVPGNGSVTVGNQVFDNLPSVKWSDYGHRYEKEHYPETSRYSFADSAIDHDLNGLEEILGKCYYLFTYILPADTNPYDPATEAAEYEAWKPIRPNGEYRAGSSAAIKSMIIDMYKVILAASTADPTTADEANAKRMAEAILDRADDYFFTADSGQNLAGDYKSLSSIQGSLDSRNVVDEATWSASYSLAKDLNKHPFENFGIPEGAAQLGFVVKGHTHPEGSLLAGCIAENDEFFYYHPNRPLVNPTVNWFEPRKYLYPAELWYYVNSPIRTTNTDITVGSYPDGVTPWNADASWTGWDFPGKVASSTRGVAVANSINYGVALLKSSVVYASGVLQLEDNRYALSNHAEPNKTINVTNAQLELRGILVGGVNPRMNWQFTRKYTSGTDHEGLGDLSLFDGVIYDHSLPSNTIPTPAASPNYTLVYDNFDSSANPLTTQNDVYVALEFVNGGDAFWGRDNLIPHGGVFYLVAQLPKPTASQQTALVWPTDHQIPPVWGVDGEAVTAPAVAGDSKHIARVFIQDFMTTATFKIGATSLQKAYYSVPDLRASQMSLGLSVDLQWTPGINYEIEL